MIDGAWLAALLEKSRLLPEAENLADRGQLEQLLRAASNYGFAATEGNGWRILPAVFRYLDRFEETAHLPVACGPQEGAPQQAASEDLQ